MKDKQNQAQKGMSQGATSVAPSARAANKGVDWKRVGAGAGAGIMLGGMGTGLMSATSHDSTNNFTDELHEHLGMSHAASDEMDFAEAFEAARADVGEGGVFVWHGNVYSTYTPEEWDELDPATREQYSAEGWSGMRAAPEYAKAPAQDDVAVSDDVAVDNDADVRMETDDKGEDDFKDESPEPGSDLAPEDNMHAAADKQPDMTDDGSDSAIESEGSDDTGYASDIDDTIDPAEIVVDDFDFEIDDAVVIDDADVEPIDDLVEVDPIDAIFDEGIGSDDIEVLGVINDDVSGIGMAMVDSYGTEVVLIDIDNNGVVDYAAIDVNHDGNLTLDEIVDVSDENMSFDDLAANYDSGSDDINTFDDGNV